MLPPDPLSYAPQTNDARQLASCADFWQAARLTAAVTLVLLWLVPILIMIAEIADVPKLGRFFAATLVALLLFSSAHVFTARMAVPARRRVRAAVCALVAFLVKFVVTCVFSVVPLVLFGEWAVFAALGLIPLLFTRPLYRAARNPHPPTLPSA